MSSRCKSCGAEIEWVRSQVTLLSGKTTASFFPVNPGFVDWDEIPIGTVLLDHYGQKYTKKEEGSRAPTFNARVSHRSTCLKGRTAEVKEA
jgi:hypothetical protein